MKFSTEEGLVLIVRFARQYGEDVRSVFCILLVQVRHGGLYPAGAVYQV